FGTGALVLLLDIFWLQTPRDDVPADPARPSEKSVLHFLSALGAVIAGAIVCARLGSAGAESQGYFYDAVREDRFSSAMSLLIILGTVLSLLGAGDALRRRGLEHGEFHCLVLFAAGSMVLFTQSMSLIMLFLSLETLSMAVYILTAYSRDEKRSVEGALKYFILGSLSAAFLLLGLAFIYGATRRTNLTEIAAIIQESPASIDQPLLLVGLGLTLIGLAFKIGAFPFHAWVPDAYEGALSIVTGFMAVTVKAASFAVLLRLGLVFGSVPGSGLEEAPVRETLITAVSVLAVLTMIFGNLVAVVQTSVKRMLAYSAIAHTGYLLVGVAATLETRGTPDAAAASVLFYLFPYSLMSLGAFACLSHLGQGSADREKFESYRGLSHRHPGVAFGLLVFMASFVGIPPTAGFWGKLFLFRQAIDAGHWTLALVGIITSVISAYYYLGLVVAMYMRPAEDLGPPTLESRTTGALAIGIAIVAVILVGLFPDVFLKLSSEWALR
ncbi:MAG TPA: NADH-quinone oxidoreductase subunit N, partial [Planctomycetota bacterium]|nr:NADH-quinone oxidoreductase subunit N [Planctomycetota bacterium]